MHALLKATIGLALATVPMAASAEPGRAVENYKALATGAKQWQQLSPLEQAEVRDVRRIIREKGYRGYVSDRRTLAERCRDNQRIAGATPTFLEQQIIDLTCGE